MKTALLVNEKVKISLVELTVFQSLVSRLLLHGCLKIVDPARSVWKASLLHNKLRVSLVEVKHAVKHPQNWFLVFKVALI